MLGASSCLGSPGTHTPAFLACGLLAGRRTQGKGRWRGAQGRSQGQGRGASVAERASGEGERRLVSGRRGQEGTFSSVAQF